MQGKYLYDTHFHLDLFENFQEMADRIESHRTHTIAVTNLPILYKRLNEVLNYKYLRPAIGFHPELVSRKYIDQLPYMLDQIKHVRYIGEIGLDFTTNLENKRLQIDVFSSIIKECADSKNKVLTIHSRGASKEILEIVGDLFAPIVILHWYTGNIKTLNRALEMGIYFSVNYAMTKSQKGIDIIRRIPLNRLLLESDGPFVKVKGKISTPLNLSFVVIELAKLKEMTNEDMLIQLQSNFRLVLERTA